jgi:tetratricopeptide (TPR) repeat protein
LALDPNYSEAWNWLGNSLYFQGRYREAIDAYERAIELDPLFPSPAENMSMTALELGDEAALDRVMGRLTTAGASAELLNSLKADQARDRGDYSGALKLLSDQGVDENGRPRRLMWSSWFQSLTSIGYYDALHRVTGCPDWYAPMVTGTALPPTTFEGKPVMPEEFWTSIFFSAPASRAMVELGHSHDLVRLYRAGFRNADDFISVTEQHNMLPELSASVAAALRTEGAEEEASYLLTVAARDMEQILKRSPSRLATGRLALVRAAQGQRSRSTALLDTALRRGWMPDGRSIALDLAREPAFRELRGDPRFEAARKRILDHVAKERAELGPLKV